MSVVDRGSDWVDAHISTEGARQAMVGAALFFIVVGWAFQIGEQHGVADLTQAHVNTMYLVGTFSAIASFHVHLIRRLNELEEEL